MISFIVIGQNEGWKLIKCFESIFKTIEFNGLKNYEVLYVDSKSTDDSIANAKKYNNIKIVLLTGDCNAAVARNVGVKEAKGDVLFFIDGDMEIVPENLKVVYNEISGLCSPFISANFQNYYYDKNWNYLNKDNGLYPLESDFYTFTTGGLFLIETDLWNKFNGMDNRFKKSQDIDFALRLAKSGYMLLRKKEILAIHHMIPYLDKNRKWKSFFDNLYARSFLYRNNFLNKYAWERMIRNDASVLILLSCLFVFLIPQILFFTLPGYLLYILIKTLRKKQDYFSNYIYFILRDLLVIIGFFSFYPVKSDELYSVISIDNNNLLFKNIKE